MLSVINSFAKWRDICMKQTQWEQQCDRNEWLAGKQIAATYGHNAKRRNVPNEIAMKSI